MVDFIHQGSFILIILFIVDCKYIENRLAAYYCATGAYHEYFLVEGEHFDESSLLSPCDLSNDFPAACYRAVFMHKPSILSKGYKTVAHICLAMTDASQRRGCFHGYGLMFTKSIINPDGITLMDLCSMSMDKVIISYE